MGTPRLLKPVDQISRMQINASIGGECALHLALKAGICWAPDSGLGGTIGNTTGVAFTL